MPYPNEHAARLVDPDQFSAFRRKNDELGKGVSVIYGLKGEEPVIQAIRFDADEFDEAEAEDWLKEHEYSYLLFEAATGIAATVVLHSRTRPGTLVFSKQQTASGVVSRTYTKELIKVGDFYQAESGIGFTVDRPLLLHWAETFALFQERGIDVSIPAGHDFSGNPDLNRGYARGMYVEDDSLFALMELIGEQAVPLADLSDVSIYSPIEWVDGFGNVYYRPILHIALTTLPLIPGLGKFQLAASSVGCEEKQRMDFSKVASALGIKAEMTDKTAEALILSSVQSTDEKVKGLEKQIAELTQKNADLVLSSAPKKADETTVAIAADALKTKLESLVLSGRITAAVSKKLNERFLGDKNLVLSAAIGTGQYSMLAGILEDLTENDPVSLLEKSKAQSLALSNRGQSTNVLVNRMPKGKKA